MSRVRRLLPQRTLASVAIVIVVAALGAGCSKGGSGERGDEVGASTDVIGYVPYWDQERGFATVRQHLTLFDEVSPMWYSLDGAGRVVLTDAENTVVDVRTVRFLQAKGIKVIPTITDLRNGDWHPETVRSMLHDPDRRKAHVRRVANLVMTNRYDGIDVDYEDLQANDRAAYTAFLRELAAVLHPRGKVLTSAVHPKLSDAGDDGRNAAQDFRAIGATVDQVRVMTYDYHWDTSPPGPVAPAEWVRDVIAWTVGQIPSRKVVLGAVLLGYDWVDGLGQTVDYLQATSLARMHHARVVRSPDGTPSFSYTAHGKRHAVWFEDATSVRAKLDLVSKYRLGGVFFWRLGGEDPDVWGTTSRVTGNR